MQYPLITIVVAVFFSALVVPHHQVVYNEEKRFGGKLMDYNIELTEKPSQPVLSVHIKTGVDNLPRELGRAYGTVIHYLNEIGKKPLDVAFAAYYNTDMDNLEIDAGFVVSEPLSGKGEVKAGEIPGGKQLSCLHKGPYKDCDKAYNAMMQYVEENGYEPTGVSYEFYYNSPDEVPESELLTKIMFPLKG